MDTPFRIFYKSKIHSLRTILLIKSDKMKKRRKIEMDVIHANCAGIDVGSRSHYVAIGQEDGDVKEYGVYSEDLELLCNWLLEKEITSVAMESTGNYWQNLYRALISHNIEVVLANGKFTKNAKGKKTDVKDSRWIQQLHSLGLLSGSFLPTHKTEILRTYARHRSKILDQKADTSHKMQKYLKLLNFRLDIVVRDVTGLTGISIISAICGGELNPKVLCKLRHYNCKKSEEEICKALHSNERADFLFGLNQEFKRYKFYLGLLEECDKSIAELLNKHVLEMEDATGEMPEAKPHKRLNKNSVKGVDLNTIAFQYFNGVDLFAIPGVSYSTILTLMSEVGLEGFENFKSAKHFTSWLRLAPNNKISGGRILSNKVPKGSNRLKIALRNSANAIGRMKDTALSKYFAKLAFKKGRQSAITATARKLAVIIWNMITKQVPYEPKEQYLFLDQRRKQIALMRKKIAKFGIDPNDLGIFSRPEYKAKHLKRLSDNQGIN